MLPAAEGGIIVPYGKWIYPVLSVAFNLACIQTFKAGTSFPWLMPTIWAAACILPIWGITSVILGGIQLHPIHSGVLIGVNLLLMIPPVFWSCLILIGLAFGGLHAASAMDKFTATAGMAILCYILYMIVHFAS